MTGEPSCQTTSQDERAGLEPGDPTQRVHVGTKAEVSVTLLPARDPVAGHRVHLHLEREVVAASTPLLRDIAFEEELRVEPLAHESALHVRERDDDRVDRAALDLGFQLVGGHAGDPSGRMA